MAVLAGERLVLAGEQSVPDLVWKPMKGPWNGFSDSQLRISLFDVRFWALCRLLWYGEDGKHRDRLIEYLRYVLRGGPDGHVFEQILWGGADPDWEALDREYRAYVDEMLREK